MHRLVSLFVSYYIRTRPPFGIFATVTARVLRPTYKVCFNRMTDHSVGF